MLWVLPLACCAAGASVLAALAARLRREVEPVAVLVDRFGREHHVALARLRDETSETRRRLPGS